MEPLVREEVSEAHFLHDRLERSLMDEHVRLSDEAKFYVLSLLVSQKNAPYRGSRSVAERILLAQDVRGRLQQELLQGAGDDSLLLAGYWWLRLANSLVDVDYFISTGSLAYAQLPDRSLREISRKFASIANALVAMGLQDWPSHGRNILRLYEVWQKTHNPVLARALQNNGINPIAWPQPRPQ